MLLSMTTVGYQLVEPDISDIVTEDDTPVDNIASEKQQRLLTEPLYTSWTGPPPVEGFPRPFLATANVGLFSSVNEPPLVPDALLSVDVQAHPDFWEKKHRSYFVWELGKPPDVVIEVVSNKEGGELTTKKRRYAKMRIAFYVVWDPSGELSGEPLQAFELRGDLYVPVAGFYFESLGLGLKVWRGVYEGVEADWLRWHLPGEELVPTGAERAEHEKHRAEHEKQRADTADARAALFLQKLRAAGIDPDAP
jgi:hypothetical protein